MKLNLKDRYLLAMYSLNLPCTLALRSCIDSFLAQIRISDSEVSTYNVVIDPTGENFTCSDDSYVVEYEKFPAAIISSITSMKKMLKAEISKEGNDNQMAKRMVDVFEKVV
jgi:hypothetical protein